MKNINRQPGAKDKEEEVKTGPLSNRGLKVTAAGGKSTFAKHRNTNSISGAGAIGLGKGAEARPGLTKTNSIKEPGSALSKKSSVSGQAGAAAGRPSLASARLGAKKEEGKLAGSSKLAEPAPARRTTLAPTANKTRFGMKAARPTIAIEEVPNDESEQTGGGESVAEQMFSGATPREESIDSFKTDEGEIENQSEAAKKAEVENVVAKKSEEKKKETPVAKGLEKKPVTHHATKSTI